MCEHIEGIQNAVQSNAPWTTIRALIRKTPTRNYGVNDRHALLDAGRYIARKQSPYEGVKAVERFGMGKLDRSENERPLHVFYATGVPVAT